MENAAIARKKAFAKTRLDYVLLDEEPKKKAPKAKKVVAKVTKPVTVKTKIVVKVKKTRKGKSCGKK